MKMIVEFDCDTLALYGDLEDFQRELKELLKKLGFTALPASCGKTVILNSAGEQVATAEMREHGSANMSRKIDYKKYLVTHEVDYGEEGVVRYTNAFILPDHYNHCLDTYLDMADEARKDFPNLTTDEIECRTVIRSNFVKGFPVIRFRVTPGTTMEGWTDCRNLHDIMLS